MNLISLLQGNFKAADTRTIVFSCTLRRCNFWKMSRRHRTCGHPRLGSSIAEKIAEKSRETIHAIFTDLFFKSHRLCKSRFN